MFYSLDFSWGELTERSYQKEDDEAGRRREKTLNLTIHLAFVFLHIYYLIFCFPLFLQTRLEMQKALDQDSTVYDYDSVYDDMQKQKLESNKKVLGGADKRVISKKLKTQTHIQLLCLKLFKCSSVCRSAAGKVTQANVNSLLMCYSQNTFTS